jgi:hypothetical protein
LPAFITNASKSRRARNFRVDKIRELLGDERKPAIDTWLAALRRLMRRRAALAASAKIQSGLIGPRAANPEALTDAATIKVGFEDVTAAHDSFAAALSEYDPLEKAVSTALRSIVDAESKTAGWQELIDLSRDQANLRAALTDQGAREQLAKEIKQALKQIDAGNEKVLDKKFEELSGGVQKWWDLLRPDELSFFSGVIPRPGARRTIDFKAGLSVDADRSSPKVRDVIAVFSMSQLHCLGLSLFLARAIKEGAGFSRLSRCTRPCTPRDTHRGMAKCNGGCRRDHRGGDGLDTHDTCWPAPSGQGIAAGLTSSGLLSSQI